MLIFSPFHSWTCCCLVIHMCPTLCEPMDLQHARIPCPSLSLGICSNSCPLNRWYHPTISSSVTPFSSCPYSFLASGSFPISRFFTSGGQSIGVSALASVLPMNIQDWSFMIDWFDLLAIQGTLESSPAPQLESINSLGAQPSLWSTYHICTRLLKNHSWLDEPFSAKWCLLFLIRCLGLLCFSSKEQVSFNFMATVTICSDSGAQENKVCHGFYFFPIY